MNLQVATTVSKRWLVEKLRNYCNEDLSFLDNPKVNEQNLIFALQARKINVTKASLPNLRASWAFHSFRTVTWKRILSWRQLSPTKCCSRIWLCRWTCQTGE
jgi:hypothetical protein